MLRKATLSRGSSTSFTALAFRTGGGALAARASFSFLSFLPAAAVRSASCLFFLCAVVRVWSFSEKMD